MENDELNNLNRRIGLNPNNHNLNHISESNNKIKIFLLINILILMTFCNFSYNQKIDTKDNNLLPNLSTSILYYFENNYIGPNNFPKKYLLRNILEENSNIKKENSLGAYQSYPNSFFRGNYDILINKLENSRIFYYLINNEFSFNWESLSYYDQKNNKTNKIFKIGKSNSGKGYLSFKRAIAYPYREDALGISMTNYENGHIDNWIKLTSYSFLKNIYKYKSIKNNNIQILGNFVTTLTKGKFFNLIEKETKKCISEFSMNFPVRYEIFTHLIGNNVHKYNLTLINVSHFNMVIESTCGFKLNITASLFSQEN